MVQILACAGPGQTGQVSLVLWLVGPCRPCRPSSACVTPPQKDADRALVVAVTCHAVFESSADDGDNVFGMGVAFPLLQVRM